MNGLKRITAILASGILLAACACTSTQTAHQETRESPEPASPADPPPVKRDADGDERPTEPSDQMEAWFPVYSGLPETGCERTRRPLAPGERFLGSATPAERVDRRSAAWLAPFEVVAADGDSVEAQVGFDQDAFWVEEPVAFGLAGQKVDCSPRLGFVATLTIGATTASGDGRLVLPDRVSVEIPVPPSAIPWVTPTQTGELVLSLAGTLTSGPRNGDLYSRADASAGMPTRSASLAEVRLRRSTSAGG